MTTTVDRPLVSATSWSEAAACQGSDLEEFFADSEKTQRLMQDLCRGCPSRTSCLTDILKYEDGSYYMRWGVSGGLTAVQRRALRCEALLGNIPNWEQAAELASPAWTSRMKPLYRGGFLPEGIAAELRKQYSVIAAPVTVRLAVWWAGDKGSVLPHRGRDDRRLLWEVVRDESRDVVGELRSFGAGSRDISAYLQVSVTALNQATRAWETEDAAQDAKALEEVA